MFIVPFAEPEDEIVPAIATVAVPFESVLTLVRQPAGVNRPGRT